MSLRQLFENLIRNIGLVSWVACGLASLNPAFCRFNGWLFRHGIPEEENGEVL